MIRPQFTSLVETYNTSATFPTVEWDENTKINYPRIKKSNSVWNLFGLFLAPEDKAVVLVGASPSLARDAEKLRECDDDFRIISVNSALKFLLNKGVKPHYVIALDSDTPDLYEHLDVDSKDLTLIASNIVSPKVLDNWKGKIWFMPYYSLTDKKLQKRLRAKLGKTVYPAGNALGTALSLSVQVLGARIFVLVASECCYEKNYYPSKAIKRSNVKGVEWFIPDINGNERVTTSALHVYKLWLEMAAVNTYPYTKIIDTSEGILGVDKRSRIYTYELSEIIRRIKEANVKKREVQSYAQDIMRDATLQSQRSFGEMPGGTSRVDVRSDV